MANRPNYTRVWASEGKVEDPLAKYAQGWLTTEKPEHTHENYLQQNEDEFAISTMESGIPAWGSDVTYKKGAVTSKGGYLYVALIDNKDISPPDAGAWIRSFGDGSATDVGDVLRGLGDKIYTHANSSDDPHSVTAGQIDTYTTGESDSKIAAVQSGVNAHEARSDNPHDVTYQQIGCLGAVTGGNFTGQVDFDQGVNLSGKYVDDAVLVSGANTFGIHSEGYPHYNNEWLFTDVNYPERRNVVEPLYSVPTPDIIMPLARDLTTWQGGGYVTASWDNLVFEDAGLRLDGELTFSGEDFLGVSTSFRVRLTGDVDITLGTIQLTKTGDTVSVVDGANTVTTDKGDGYYTYVRGGGGIALAFEGVTYATKKADLPAMAIDCSITGTGNIKDLMVWSSVITEEQNTHLNPLTNSPAPPPLKTYTPNFSGGYIDIPKWETLNVLFHIELTTKGLSFPAGQNHMYLFDGRAAGDTDQIYLALRKTSAGIVADASNILETIEVNGSVITPTTDLTSFIGGTCTFRVASTTGTKVGIVKRIGARYSDTSPVHGQLYDVALVDEASSSRTIGYSCKVTSASVPKDREVASTPSGKKGTMVGFTDPAWVEV